MAINCFGAQSRHRIVNWRTQAAKAFSSNHTHSKITNRSAFLMQLYWVIGDNIEMCDSSSLLQWVSRMLKSWRILKVQSSTGRKTWNWSATLNFNGKWRAKSWQTENRVHGKEEHCERCQSDSNTKLICQIQLSNWNCRKKGLHTARLLEPARPWSLDICDSLN